MHRFFFQVTRIFTKSQVDTFGSVIQDNNFLHTEIDWEDDFEKLQKAIPVTRAHLDAGLIRPSLQTSDATKNIASTTTPLVHGMLVSSIFSSIFAGLVPGCIYVNQTLSFVNPVFVNELVIGRVQISKIRPWRKGGVLVQCDTQVLGTNSTVDEKQQQQQRQLIKGEANVWLPEGY
jgi:acyl dehydratase